MMITNEYKMTKRLKLISVRDMDDWYHDTCMDYKIDPGVFVARKEEIFKDLRVSFNQYVKFQEKRAARFENLEAELDKLDKDTINRELGEICDLHSRNDVYEKGLAYMRELVKPIQPYYDAKHDFSWCHHPMYRFFKEALDLIRELERLGRNGWSIKELKCSLRNRANDDDDDDDVESEDSDEYDG